MLEKCQVTTKDIGELLIHLPGKDFTIGSKFVAERKFEELKELIDSCIKKYDRYKSYREAHPDFNEDGILQLKEYVNEYCRFLCIEEETEREEIDETYDTDEYEEFCYFIMANR